MVLENQPLQNSLVHDLESYMDSLSYLDEHIDRSRENILYGLPPLIAENGQRNSDIDFINQLNQNVATRSHVIKQFSNPEQYYNPEVVNQYRSAEEFILLEGQANDPNVAFQQYQSLTPLHLESDPVYWYTLKKLPFVDATLFFNEDLPPTTVIATGLNQIRLLLNTNQEAIFSTWLNRLADGLVAVKEKREKSAAKDYESLIDDFNDLLIRRATIQIGLDLELQYWNSLKQEGYSIKGKHKAPNYVKEHDYQAIKYLKEVFENPSVHNLFDWSEMDNINQYFLQAEKIPEDRDERSRFLRNMPDSIQQTVIKANRFMDEFSAEVQERILKLQAKIGMGNFIKQYDITKTYYQFFMNLPIVQYRPLGVDYPGLVDSLRSVVKLNQLPIRPANRIPISTVPANFFLAACDDLPPQIRTDAYASSRDEQFNQVKDEIEIARNQLVQLQQQKKRLGQRFHLLEEQYANQLFLARQHVEQLTKLTAITTHILYALKAKDNQKESITVTDSLFQKVTRSQLMDNGETIEITYDSLILRQKTIAQGAKARKWLQPSDVVEIFENEALEKAFFGLLSERLATVDASANYEPKNLKLLVRKAVFAINEVDEQAALLRSKKTNNLAITFSDYYPFIRTTIDLLNIVLQTPFNQEQALIDKFDKLKNLPKISDESLSLFENIFAEQYPDAIHNVMRLLAIIWDIDTVHALTEQQANNQLILNKANGDRSSFTKLDKRTRKKNKKVKAALLVYGSFMANVVAAQNANQVKAAIRSVAVPPGSSSVKRKTDFNVSFNAYFGLGLHREKLNNALIPENQQTGNTVGLSVPIGISTSLGALGKNNNWGLSLFVPILDIGGVTAFRLSDDGATSELPELTFSNLISPGGYLMLNLPKSPFSIGVGAQYGPQVRKVTINETELNSSAWKMGITASIDVPIFNLFSR